MNRFADSGAGKAMTTPSPASWSTEDLPMMQEKMEEDFQSTNRD